MKFKVGEFRNISEGLEEILTKELPVKPAYWLARFLIKLDSEVKAFERVRLNLAVQHAKKDKDGNPILIIRKDKDGKDINEYKIADAKAFEKEFLELIEEEIEIDFKPIKLEALGDVKLKPITLAKLGKIIEE